MSDYEYSMNVEDTSSGVRALCTLLVDCAVELYNTAGDEISLAAELEDGRTISITIKEDEQNEEQ